MKLVPFEPGIEVNGQTVLSVVEGFAAFRKIPSDILLGLGIGKRDDRGYIALEPDAWVPQAAWLEGFSKISEAIGTGALFGIGQKIPECAIFPPWVVDVHSAIRAIDVAYHLNHRKGGKVMFDPVSATMLEGIGHYGYEPVIGERRILVRCENPYPCDFDRGIVTAMAQRFAGRVWLEHVDPGTCRKTGARHCTYAVTWRDEH